MFKEYEKIMLRPRGGITIPKNLRDLLQKDDGLIEISLEKNEIVLHEFNYTKQESGCLQLIGARKIASTGSLAVPTKAIAALDLKPKDILEIYQEQEHVIVRKFSKNRCIFTGEISENNYKFLNDKIVLSRTGLEHLLEEIKDVLR
ncbi:MAG: hypothetical protein ACQEWW_23125 [Bacillota bacterium]